MHVSAVHAFVCQAAIAAALQRALTAASRRGAPGGRWQRPRSRREPARPPAPHALWQSPCRLHRLLHCLPASQVPEVSGSRCDPPHTNSSSASPWPPHTGLMMAPPSSCVKGMVISSNATTSAMLMFPASSIPKYAASMGASCRIGAEAAAARWSAQTALALGALFRKYSGSLQRMLRCRPRRRRCKRHQLQPGDRWTASMNACVEPCVEPLLTCEV